MSDTQPRSRLLDRINQANAAHAATETAPSTAAAAAQAPADEKPQGGRRGSSDSSAGSRASDPESLASAPSQEPGHTKSVISLLAVTTNFVLLAALLGGSAWVFHGIGSTDKTAELGKPSSSIALGILVQLGEEPASYAEMQKAAPKANIASTDLEFLSQTVLKTPEKHKAPNKHVPRKTNKQGDASRKMSIKKKKSHKSPPPTGNTDPLNASDFALSPQIIAPALLTPPPNPNNLPPPPPPNEKSDLGGQAHTHNNQKGTFGPAPKSDLSALLNEKLNARNSNEFTDARNDLEEKLRNKFKELNLESKISDQSNLIHNALAQTIVPMTLNEQQNGTGNGHSTGSGSAPGNHSDVAGSHSSSESDEPTSLRTSQSSGSEGTSVDFSQVTEQEKEPSSDPKLNKNKQIDQSGLSTSTDSQLQSPSSATERQDNPTPQPTLESSGSILGPGSNPSPNPSPSSGSPSSSPSSPVVPPGSPTTTSASSSSSSSSPSASSTPVSTPPDPSSSSSSSSSSSPTPSSTPPGPASLPPSSSSSSSTPSTTTTASPSSSSSSSSTSSTESSATSGQAIVSATLSNAPPQSPSDSPSTALTSPSDKKAPAPSDPPTTPQN